MNPFYELYHSVRVSRLAGRYSERSVRIAYVMINGFIAIGLISALAKYTHAPFIFPSLGASALVLFLTPFSPGSTPRHTILGHTIGMVCGYAALLIVGLENAGPAMLVGIDDHRVLACAISVALTGALMHAFQATHPPGGATALIVALGLMSKPQQLLVVELGVGLLVLQAIVINRAAGIEYPLWARKKS